MNRPRRYLLGAIAALLTAAAPTAYAANTLFIDDFKNPAASDSLWENKAAASGMNAAVNGGSCAINNSANPYFGEYVHVFGENKPATFTLSYTLKSLQGGGTAGALFCRRPGDAPNGYILTAEDDTVLVYKVTSTVSSSSISINNTPVFYKKSFDLKQDGNVLTVSKSGSSFHIFVNGVFEGSFTDTSYNAGDVSFALSKNTAAVFGPISITDAFTEGSPRTSFHDDFNGNGLKYWWFRKIGSPTATEANGALTVKTAADENAWLSVDFEQDNFTAKVDASHRAGSTSSIYGLILVGETPPGQSIPMAHFAIRGDRKFVLLTTGSTAYLETNEAIKGAAVDGTFFVDNLEIKKSAGSSEYVFSANGTLLAKYPAADVGFKVAGVGIFCYGDLEVAFDNFSILKEGTTSVKHGTKQISRTPSSPATTRAHAFYDMRGRKRYTATASTQGRIQTRAAGVYVNKNGRDVAVKKGRVADR